MEEGLKLDYDNTEMLDLVRVYKGTSIALRALAAQRRQSFDAYVTAVLMKHIEAAHNVHYPADPNRPV